MTARRRIKKREIDSHIGGESTWLVLAGFPELSALALAQQVEELRAKFNHFRAPVASKPRASDVVVGAFESGSVAPVILFNNVGYLGICGHGTIGVIVTLQHFGKISHGVHRLDKPRWHGLLHVAFGWKSLD